MGHSARFGTLTDEELVSLCNSGGKDEALAAFGALYERHKDFVIRVALRFVPDTDSALDVLQETFSYLLRQFPPSGTGLRLTAKLTTYLYPVAKNTAISLRRKAERFPQAAGISPDLLPGRPDPAATEIDPLLAGLSGERREVLLLRFVDELSLAEIAATLGVPLGTVKSRLHLALKQLRDSPAAINLREP